MDYKDYQSGKVKLDFWFRAKNNLIGKLLSREFSKKKKLKILNLGAGTGSDLEILNNFGEVYVIDIEERALDLIPNNLCVEKKVCDACKLIYPDNFFDLVVSFDVFEHIKNHEIAIKEAHRVLKKQGTLLFSVPALQFLYGSHDKALKHERRYSKEELRKLLKKFIRVKLFYWNCILFSPIAFLRILKKRENPKVDNPNFNKFFDEVLFKILVFENFLIQKKIKFLIGISLIGICKKL